MMYKDVRGIMVRGNRRKWLRKKNRMSWAMGLKPHEKMHKALKEKVLGFTVG